MKISVIMPVYNGEKYLNEAIDSILNQTFKDFEFIIINDCSKDNTEKIILSYSDDRIVYVKNDTNLGVAATLNRGLEMAKGEYIARMDADDISLPDRFELQVRFLDENKDIAVVGSGVEFFGFSDETFYNSFDTDIAKIDLLFNSCIAHPSVMMRKCVIDQGYHYDLEFDKVEDYHLWIRISEKYKLCSLKEVLLKYRIHENQITKNYSDDYKQKIYKIKKYQLEFLNIEYSNYELEAFFSYCINEFNINFHFEDFASLLNKIYSNNDETHIYNKLLLKKYFSGLVFGILNRYNVKFKYEFIKKFDYISFKDYYRFKLKRLIKG